MTASALGPGAFEIFLLLFVFVFLLHHTACRILVSRPGIEPVPLAVKVWSPNPWTSREFSVYFVLFCLFVCLYLAVLDLHCCMQAFSSCREWGLLFIAVHGLLVAVSSLVAEHGL